jgi:phage tail-like protein
MPITTALATRRDPLKNYQFIVSVEIDKRLVTVGGVQRVSGLSASVSSAETWEGGNNLHRYANPDRVTWDNLTLEQGIALDDTLEVWADAVRYYVMSNRLKPSPTGGPGLAVKRNLTIELWPPSNVDGPPAPPAQPSRRYRIYNAWISKYIALPKLDALASEVALLTVEIVHEGWTVDLLGPTDSVS